MPRWAQPKTAQDQKHDEKVSSLRAKLKAMVEAGDDAAGRIGLAVRLLMEAHVQSVGTGDVWRAEAKCTHTHHFCGAFHSQFKRRKTNTHTHTLQTPQDAHTRHAPTTTRHTRTLRYALLNVSQTAKLQRPRTTTTTPRVATMTPV